MNKLRFYIDNSVFGGCFDKEFEKDSRALFDEIRSGQSVAVVTDLVLFEISRAPECVRRVYDDLPDGSKEFFRIGPEVRRLAEDYLEAGVVTRKSAADAAHVAAATVARVSAIVSWNFKHIVNLQRIHGFNGVNLMKGYGVLDIHSPQAVLLRKERTDE